MNDDWPTDKMTRRVACKPLKIKLFLFGSGSLTSCTIVGWLVRHKSLNPWTLNQLIDAVDKFSALRNWPLWKIRHTDLSLIRRQLFDYVYIWLPLCYKPLQMKYSTLYVQCICIVLCNIYVLYCVMYMYCIQRCSNGSNVTVIVDKALQKWCICNCVTLPLV